MSDKLLSEMSYDEFDALMNVYIDQSSQQTGEIPASSFFELLFNQVAQRVTDTFELEGRIVDGKLVFELPQIPLPNVFIQDNQILIGNQRIVVNLAPA